MGENELYGFEKAVTSSLQDIEKVVSVEVYEKDEDGSD